MKYIRTYDDYESYKAEYSDTSREFRLKPTLYKYSEAGDHVQLELDDPRKHGDSTYIEITLDSDVEFSFYIGNAPDDTQTTMNCSIDWGDGTTETKTITEEIMTDDYNDNKGFKLSHNYKTGSYKIELYGVERDYSIAGGNEGSSMGIPYYDSHISHPSSIKRVILGSSVVSMGNGAFTWCTSLTSIHISKRITSIGIGVFDECSSLTSVYIPNSVTSIGGYAFRQCRSLVSIHIPESVTSIGEQAFFYCISLTSVYIPSGVTSIEFNTFYSCSSLTSVYISEGVTSIGAQVFGDCSSLTSIHIPEGVTSIDYRAFDSCSSLTSINIPEGVTSIGYNAFEGCSSLTSISFPESVTSIGDRVIDGCRLISSISSFNSVAPTTSEKSLYIGFVGRGTLHIKPGATGYDAWLSQLSSPGYDWTIVEDL